MQEKPMSNLKPVETNHPTHEYFYPYHHPLLLYRLYQRLTSRLSASRNSLGWKFLHEWAKNRAPSRPTEEGKREQSVGKRGGCKKHRERERRRGTGRNGKDTHPETPSSPIYFYRQFSLPFLLDLSPPNHPWRGISRFFNPRGSQGEYIEGGDTTIVTLNRRLFYRDAKLRIQLSGDGDGRFFFPFFPSLSSFVNSLMTRSRLGEGENIGRNILWDARDGNGNPPSFLLGYLMRLGINLMHVCGIDKGGYRRCFVDRYLILIFVTLDQM